MKRGLVVIERMESHRTVARWQITFDGKWL